MKRLSSRFYMALGMSALVVTALLLALFAGLVPDRDSALRQGRTALAESVALSVTLMLGDEDSRRIQQVLDFARERNESLRSPATHVVDSPNVGRRIEEKDVSPL